VLAQAADRVRILHVSDFHFVGKLTERGTRLRTRAFMAKSHDFTKLEALNRILTLLAGPGRGFDYLVVTGDVSTDGATSSLETARSFIEEDELIDPVVKRLVAHGLESPSDRRTVIPGNHDRYGRRLPIQRRQRHFEETFEDASYPRVQVIKADEVSGRPDIVLFLFDSTQVLHLRHRFDPRKRIARGEVGLGECDSLIRRSWDIARDGHANGVQVDLANCVRIVLLHHHPILPKETDRPNYLTSMDNDKLFCRSCLEAGINMVLFGHQHFAYQVTGRSTESGRTPFGDVAPVHFFCSASTSEYSETDAGFYLYDVGTSGVDAYQFRWSGAGFSRRPEVMTRQFR
jgi:3',5'-cyclic AMP phosphodiesterase CpdA